MNIERIYNGAYVITEVINGYRVKRVYLGYTKAEAVKLFKEYRKGLKNG